MTYVIGFIIIWAVVSALLLLNWAVVSALLLLKQERQVPVDGLMGSARNVFELEKEKEAEEDNVSTGDVLSEDDFEVEYDSFEMKDIDDIEDEDNTAQEGSIIGFKEMQQMVVVMEDNKPLSNLDNESLESIKQTVKKLEDTDFIEKMKKTREDISRRIDDILNNINI